MKKIFLFIARVPTMMLITTSYTLFFLSLFLVLLTDELRGYPHFILLSLALFFWGTAGIPMIIRKEAPPFIERNGWAVALGCLHIIIGWSLSLLPIIHILR